MKLTDARLRSLNAPGRHFDGAGLYLELTPSGGKYWRLKYRHAGREKRLAFGVYPEVSLKEARERASDARRIMRSGADPGALRKAEKAKAAYEAANTLEAIARDWLAHQSARWAPITLSRITASLETYVFRTLGNRPASTIRPGELMAAVKQIEAGGAREQAGRVLQRVKSIYRWALTHERIESNPMGDLIPSEILRPYDVTHRPALADAELPEFLNKLDAYQGDVHTVRALRLLMLTATRPGEVRGAVWSEFDLDAALWIIPAERMKMKIEHRVPLSRQAVAIVRSMQGLSGDGALVFPSPFYRSRPLSENTFNSALARLGYKGSATAHGFRALFSTVANERGWNPDAIERQLAHIEGNRVRAAYHRSSYLEDRVRLMQWWADYLDGRREGRLVPAPKRWPRAA